MAAVRTGLRLALMPVRCSAGVPVRKEEVTRVLEIPLVSAVDAA